MIRGYILYFLTDFLLRPSLFTLFFSIEFSHWFSLSTFTLLSLLIWWYFFYFILFARDVICVAKICPRLIVCLHSWVTELQWFLIARLCSQSSVWRPYISTAARFFSIQFDPIALSCYLGIFRDLDIFIPAFISTVLFRCSQRLTFYQFT